jgi:hypothetical protein
MFLHIRSPRLLSTGAQVEEEDYLLCVATQRNLNTGIYSRGVLHPDKEVCFQYLHH